MESGRGSNQDDQKHGNSLVRWHGLGVISCGWLHFMATYDQLTSSTSARGNYCIASRVESWVKGSHARSYVKFIMSEAPWQSPLTIPIGIACAKDELELRELTIKRGRVRMLQLPISGRYGWKGNTALWRREIRRVLEALMVLSKCELDGYVCLNNSKNNADPFLPNLNTT